MSGDGGGSVLEGCLYEVFLPKSHIFNQKFHMHTVHLYLILAKEKEHLIYCICFLNVLNKAMVLFLVMNAFCTYFILKPSRQ